MTSEPQIHQINQITQNIRVILSEARGYGCDNGNDQTTDELSEGVGARRAVPLQGSLVLRGL